MRASWSKKSDLDMLVGRNEKHQAEEGTSKSYSSFGSFFSRTKKPRAGDVPTLPPSSTPDEFVVMNPKVTRSRTLEKGHHRLFSRSMSDLSTFIRKEDFLKPQPGSRSPESNRIASMDLTKPGAVQESPSKKSRSTGRKEEQMPFPAHTISKRGWLNKRISRRDTTLSLQRVYLRESKLYVYRPLGDIGATHFDITEHTDRGTQTSAPDSIEAFDPAIQSKFFAEGILATSIKCMQQVLETTSGSSMQKMIVVSESSIYILSWSSEASRSITNSPMGESKIRSPSRPISCWTLDSTHLAADLTLSSLAYQSQSHVSFVIDNEVRKFSHADDVALKKLHNFLHEFIHSKRTASPTASLIEHNSTNAEPAGSLCFAKPGSICDMLLSRSAPLEPLNVRDVLLSTLGLWCSPNELINSIQKALAQDKVVSDGAILQLKNILRNSPSLVLINSFVDKLLQVLQSSERIDHSTLITIIEDLRASQNHHLLEPSDTAHWEDTHTEEFEYLSGDGFVADILLNIPTNTLAQQLYCFHDKYYTSWRPSADRLWLYCRERGDSLRHPLIFDDSDPHFLTCAVLRQLLGLEGATMDSARRATICVHWIRLAVACKRLGDLTSWLAIAFALCRAPIVRLKEMWTLVEPKHRALLQKDWASVIRELYRKKSSNHIMLEYETHVLAPEHSGNSTSASRHIPYFGDLLSTIECCRQCLLQETDDLINISTLSECHTAICKALDNYTAFAEKDGATLSKTPDEPFIDPLYQKRFETWHASASPLSEDEQMRWSLKCEPPLWPIATKTSENSISSGAFVPILFTDLLPQYSLFEASDLLDLNETFRKTRTIANESANKSAPNASIPLRRLYSFPPTNLPKSYTTGSDQLDEPTRQRTAAAVSKWRMLKHLRDITNVSDNTITFEPDELILKTSDKEAESGRRRPQSIIVDRKRESTVSRRSSMQIPAHWTIEENEELIRPGSQRANRVSQRDVVVKAGESRILLDLLIVPVSKLRSLNVIHRETNPPMNELDLNRSDYLRTFLASYRTFCTPLQLLRGLRLRATNIVSYTRQTASHLSLGDDFSMVQCSGAVDWSAAMQLYTGLCETLSVWMDVCPMDFLNSTVLLNLIRETLDSVAGQITKLQAEFSQELDSEASSCASTFATTINLYLRKLNAQLSKLRYSPRAWPLLDVASQWELLVKRSPTSMSTFEEANVALLHLDKLVESSLHAITLEDWFSLYDMLEYQAGQKMGFFDNLPELVNIDQDIRLRDASWLMHNTTYAPAEKILLEALPHSIRVLFRLRDSVTNWILEYITDATIQLDVRVHRLQGCLKLVALSLQHMKPFDVKMPSIDGFKTQVVPSFIGSAVACALVAPESRLFALAWHIVAQQAGQTGESNKFMALLPASDIILNTDLTITPCIAWLTDRMLEIVCYIPERLLEGRRMLNFDKKRYMYNLLLNLGLPGSAYPTINVLADDKNPYIFLLEYDPWIPDWKQLRTIAAKENTARTTKITRPFNHHVAQELEKARRDLKQRDFLLRQTKESGRLDYLAKVDSRSPLDNSKRSSMRSRYGMSSLFRAVRPLSVAMGSSWTQEKATDVAPHSVPAGDLPLEYSVPKGTKPLQTIDLINAVVSILSQSEQLFKVRTEDGIETYFQTTTADELEDWVKRLSLASIDGAKKRRTILFEDAKLASIEEVPQFSPRNSLVQDTTYAKFGIDLSVLAQRDDCLVPRIAIQLINEIELRGLEERGIYRISGSITTINALKIALNSRAIVSLDGEQWLDINAVAGAFKLWLRELPEPLMTYELYPSFLQTLDIEDAAVRASKLKELVHCLPASNFALLKRLLEHLEKITDYQTINHMYAHNLAIVFGPNILQPQPSLISTATSMNDLGRVQTIVRNLILQCHSIFAPDPLPITPDTSDGPSDVTHTVNSLEEVRPQSTIIEESAF